VPNKGRVFVATLDTKRFWASSDWTAGDLSLPLGFGGFAIAIAARAASRARGLPALRAATASSLAALEISRDLQRMVTKAWCGWNAPDCGEQIVSRDALRLHCEERFGALLVDGAVCERPTVDDGGADRGHDNPSMPAFAGTRTRLAKLVYRIILDLGLGASVIFD